MCVNILRFWQKELDSFVYDCLTVHVFVCVYVEKGSRDVLALLHIHICIHMRNIHVQIYIYIHTYNIKNVYLSETCVCTYCHNFYTFVCVYIHIYIYI
jgi:hypothetical protein